MIKTYFRERLLNKVYSFNTDEWVNIPVNKYRNVFVFGSNLFGDHKGGAAAFAKNYHNAKQGVAQGPTGNCYAIPTMYGDFTPLPLTTIRGFVNEFLKEAYKNPTVKYYLTPIGCGIAGYSVKEILPFFIFSPKNVILPVEFKEEFLNSWSQYKVYVKALSGVRIR